MSEELQGCREFKLVAVRECPRHDEWPVISSGSDAAIYWENYVANAPGFEPHLEHLVVVLLDGSARVMGHRLVAKGQPSGVSFSLPEIYLPGILALATSIVVLHNHPSGGPEPSGPDLYFANRIMLGMDYFGIALADFVIVSKPGKHDQKEYASLRELGHLNKIDVSVIEKPSRDQQAWEFLTSVIGDDIALETALACAAERDGLPRVDWSRNFFKSALRLHLLTSGRTKPMEAEQ